VLTELQEHLVQKLKVAVVADPAASEVFQI
jgi:hypothetical protein